MATLVVRILFVVTGTWLVTRLVTFAASLAEAFLVRDVTDEGRVRSIRTQIAVPARMVRAAVYVIGVALVFMQFEVVRSVGVSLMASAGLAGIILGFAAQRTIGNVFAGVQLAITQPIRIGDVVIVENEWGWIEEISLTYVVVKVWDLRRLVLPVGYFLERPFQSWTKAVPDILGTVFVYTDYTVPVDAIRAELRRTLENEGAPLWDGKVQGVQVTDLRDKTVEVRLLVSAKDSPTAWDLRCLVREKMLTWLQSLGKAHLPMHRVELQGLPAGAAGT